MICGFYRSFEEQGFKIRISAKPHAKPNAILSAKNLEYAVRNSSKSNEGCLMIAAQRGEYLNDWLDRTKKPSENCYKVHLRCRVQ